MLQVIQTARKGELSLAQVPPPLVRPGHVLIENACSIISAGTEKAVTDLARKSLIGKARARPDHLRRILNKIRTEGLFATLSQVNEKLNEPIAMGYSSAGTVLACGAGVQEFKPGDRVASNGPHAGVVCVPRNLCARVPDELPLEQAAFAVICSIGLQGVRLARLGLQDTVLLIGLGLIGQVCVRLLKAHGCRVLATDLDPRKCELALRLGADQAAPQLGPAEVAALTQGIGADAVLVTAATRSSEPVQLAANAVRCKGRVVVVGAVGLNLERQPLYLKEAELVVSCSYGPGRYDPAYEEHGHDYPVGHVRWTEQRNLQAVLDLMAAGRLDITPLLTHRFKIDEAARAYELIETGSEPYLGILLDYRESVENRKTPPLTWQPRQAAAGKAAVGCVGSGGFARMVLLPALERSTQLYLHSVCSAGGLSADQVAQKYKGVRVAADADEVLHDPAVQAVFIITRHHLHAPQVIKALRAGKHVFVEKPLALTLQEMSDIAEVVQAGGPAGPLLMVGFNRRFAPAAAEVKKFFAKVQAPLTVSIRFNAGEIPAEHWTQDEEVGGGRIIGEACHAIDLATFLAGAPPVRVFAESIGGPHAPAVTDDQCFITLRHANGAISNIGYLAGGDRSFAKERVEVLGGGRLAVIEDFRDVILSANGKEQRLRPWGQNKGHQAEIDAFAAAVAGGATAPIPWRELQAVSLASILAVQSIREGFPFEVPQ